MKHYNWDVISKKLDQIYQDIGEKNRLKKPTRN